MAMYQNPAAISRFLNRLNKEFNATGQAALVGRNNNAQYQKRKAFEALFSPAINAADALEQIVQSDPRKRLSLRVTYADIDEFKMELIRKSLHAKTTYQFGITNEGEGFFVDCGDKKEKCDNVEDALQKIATHIIAPIDPNLFATATIGVHTHSTSQNFIKVLKEEASKILNTPEYKKLKQRYQDEMRIALETCEWLQKRFEGSKDYTFCYETLQDTDGHDQEVMSDNLGLVIQILDKSDFKDGTGITLYDRREGSDKYTVSTTSGHSNQHKILSSAMLDIASYIAKGHPEIFEDMQLENARPETTAEQHNNDPI